MSRLNRRPHFMRRRNPSIAEPGAFAHLRAKARKTVIRRTEATAARIQALAYELACQGRTRCPPVFLFGVLRRPGSGVAHALGHPQAN